MFSFSKSPLEKLNLKDGLIISSTGAFVSFEGLVRDHNDGKKVTALEYEAYEDLGVKEAQRILDEAKSKFKVTAIKCVHRVGHLNINDMAVWVGVSASHRDAAFQCCRFVIDEIKPRLPIWKKEFYENGNSGWVNCEACSAPHAHEH